MKALTSLTFASLCLMIAMCGHAQAQISDDVVKLGVLSDMAGASADASGRGSVIAVEMAVADYGGTVKGKPIKVASADHGNAPDTAQQTARNWYENEQVDVILDLPASAIARAVLPVAKDKQRLVILSGGLPGLDNACPPWTLQWSHDARSQASVAARAIVRHGGDRWLMIAPDDETGAALATTAASTVQANGGTIVSSLTHPADATDFSALLAQARASQANVIAFADTASHLIAATREAAQIGVGRAEGKKLLALSMPITVAHAIGPKDGAGLITVDGFYWDMNDGSRAFAKAFFDKTGRMPTTFQAALYSATLHYLKAIDQTGTDDTPKVSAQMKAMPVDDFFGRNGRIGENGRLIHDLSLFTLKTMEESRGEWDLYKPVATLPGEDAFPPESQKCPASAR